VEYQATRRMGGRGLTSSQFHHALRGVALDGAGHVYAVGDNVVRVFDVDGAVARQWATTLPGECVSLDPSGRVWVGEKEQVEIFSSQGDRVDTRRDPGRLGLVTAIGFGGGDIFLADATARWIRRYDGEGRLLNNIGDRHRKGGFDIPNGVVDFAVDEDGVLHVANPGMHRVERYAADGTLLGRFGRFDGQDPAGFPGCCNPTNLTVDAQGRVIVTEKAGPRLKVYSPEGELLAVVADDVFDPNAKNMDVAVDVSGRIFVADTATLAIHVFEPVGREEAA
jgi:sugar lactone lactonase YvrE